MNDNPNKPESISKIQDLPDIENPDQVPTYTQFASTLNQLNQKTSSESTLGSLPPNLAADPNSGTITSLNRIAGSQEINDIPSLGIIPLEPKTATTLCSIQPNEQVTEDQGVLAIKGAKKMAQAFDFRSQQLARPKFQKMKSFNVKSPTVNSPTASEITNLIKGNLTPPGKSMSPLARFIQGRQRKEQEITEKDSMEDDSDDKKDGKSAGKRWRKVMVMMQALSGMKKAPKSVQDLELNQKQLELLYDFGAHRESKKEKKKLEKLEKQSSLPLAFGDYSPQKKPRTGRRGFFGVMKSAFACCRFRKAKIMPENVAKQKSRKEAKSNLSQFWGKIRRPFSPSDKFRLRWDVFLMFLVVIDMIILPLQISFSVWTDSDAQIYQYFCDAIFITDILLNFHTGYYMNGDLMINHRDIAKNYAKGLFFVDLVSAFPFHAVEESQDAASESLSGMKKPSFLKLFRILRIIKVLRALRFFKLSKIFWKFKVFFGYSQAHSLFQLLKMIIIVLLLTHWLACIWHLVAVFELEFTDNETWLNRRELLDATAAERYINSLYWAVTTILTVGYGDITPVSVPEIWTAVFSMFFACGVFAYSLNTIGGIINEIGETRAKVSWKIYAINKFMQKKNMAKELQERVRGYMEHLLEEENTRKHDQEEFLAMMPEHLKKDILMDLNGKLLTENPIFSSNFKEKFLQELATKLQEKSFGPGENIYTENDKTQENSFFIVTKGKVQLFLQKTNQSLKTLVAGQYFGEVSFFSDNKRTVSARSMNYSHVFYLEKNGFLEILDHFDLEKECFCEIRDKVNLYSDFSNLKVRCLACNKENHCTQNCPKLQYIPEWQYIIQLVRREDQKLRASFMRNGRKRFHALNDKLQIHSATEKFRDDILSLPPQRMMSRNSSLTFKPDNGKQKRSQTDLSFDSDHLLIEEEKDDKVENGINRYELLSLIEENLMEEHSRQSHVLVLSPKSMTMKLKEFSQFAEMVKAESNKTMSKKKKGEFVFEKVSIFSKYFVHNNVDNVISRINRINQLRRSGSNQDSNTRRRSTTDTLALNGVLRKPGKKMSQASLSHFPSLFRKLRHASETMEPS